MTNALALDHAKPWECPELTSLNKLPARATFTCSPLPELPGEGLGKDNPWLQSLDGEWAFRLAPDPVTALAWVSGGGTASPDESPIRVPGNWEMQGWGHPHYTNVQMPWREEPPHVPAGNPTGVYRKAFTVPKAWKGMRVVVQFGSASSLLMVYCNGRFAGLSKDSRLPAEFDLTELVAPGRANELVAVVVKWSDATFVEDQDMWWLSGLARSVRLFATPHTWIGDIFAKPLLDASCSSAELEVTVNVGFTGAPADVQAEVAIQLLDWKGRPVFEEPIRQPVSGRRNGMDHLRNLAWFRAAVPRKRLRLWSAEDPRRYRLLVALSSPHGESHASVAVGFRRVEVKERNLLINGKRVLIKGVNRHEHDDTHGKAVPRAMMLRDILVMKRFNVNAVRCSHYPPDPLWLELCDQYGLYVIDEANIESHDFHNQLCQDSRYATAWLDRTMRMVIRDKNHPSVILWSLGNESGYGPSHDAAAGWVRGYDGSRPVHYEGGISRGQSHLTFADGSRVTDIICPMYTSLQELREWAAISSRGLAARRKAAARDGDFHPDVPASPWKPKHAIPRPAPFQPVRPLDRPVILCEYSHAMGNSNGSLGEYFDLFKSIPGLQGGFIWEWLDHGIRRQAADGTAYWCYGGDFGEQPHDANFVCDGLVWPDRTPHPALWEFKHLAQPVGFEALNLRKGRIRLRNEQDFVALKGCTAYWELLVGGELLKKGRVVLPAIPPGAGQDVEFPLAGALKPGAEAQLTIRIRSRVALPFADSGHELAWQQFQIGAPPRLAVSTARRKAAPRAELSVADGSIRLDAGDTHAVFDCRTGELQELALKGRPFLASGPLLQLWRAAIDNDGLKLWSGQETKPLGRWRALGLPALKHQLLGCTHRRGKDGAAQVVVRFGASGRGQWDDAQHVQRFTLEADGVLRVENRVRFADPAMTDLPRVGVRLDLPAGFEQLRYFGRGPRENYADRSRGELVGVYQSTVAEEYVPYIMPQEHGHHTEVRWIELSHSDGRLLRVAADPVLEFNASHFTAEDLHAAFHTCDLQPRPETILYLDTAHRGLGSGSCGPDTLPRYQVRNRSYAWSYSLMPVLRR